MSEDAPVAGESSKNDSWIMLVRHGKRVHPKALGDQEFGLSESGKSEVWDVGTSLAEWWVESKCTDPIIILHADNRESEATANLLAESCQRRLTALAAPSSVRCDISTESHPPLVVPTDATRAQVKVIRNILTSYSGTVAVVVNDPLATWLLHELQRAWVPWRMSSIAPGELVALQRCKHKWPRTSTYYVPHWALTPDGAADVVSIQEKIRSKLSTTAQFGAFLTGLLTFVIDKYPVGAATRRQAWLRTTCFAGLGLGVVLFFVTLFWFDRLLMPARFWGERASKRARPTTRFLRRPPSSTGWVLYQNMQRIWFCCFIPAVISGGVGLAVFLQAKVKPNWDWWSVLGFPVVAMSVALALWRLRPTIGTRD